MVGVYTVTGSPQEAYDFYRNDSSLNPSGASSVGAGQAFVGTMKISGSFTGRVNVASSGDTPYVVVVLGTSSSSSGTTGSSRA
jgi:hypothetical protein